jgi:uncharacterized membrane protein YphA (DoxX/SURF4 family)
MTSLRNKTWRWIAVVLRIVLGVVFIYSAWAKLQEPWRIFAMDIEAYKLVTNLFWIEVIARGLPWFELLLGVWLISGFWLRGSATICAGLLTFFIGLMVWAQIHNLQINCGCFGSGEKISWLTQLRDGSLLAAALLLAVLSYLGRRAPKAPPADVSAPPADPTPA